MNENERLAEVLERLSEVVADGIISAGDAVKAVVDTVGGGAAFSRLVTLMHTEFCELDHNKRECAYYLESMIENAGEKPSHAKWIEMTKFIIKELETDASALGRAMARASVALGDLDSLSEDCLYLILRFTIIDNSKLEGIINYIRNSNVVTRSASSSCSPQTPSEVPSSEAAPA